jgi:hypothetical protein
MAKKIWFTTLAKTAGVPDRTLRHWWKAFCSESKEIIPPRKADEGTQWLFMQWLRIQGDQGEATRTQQTAARAQRQSQAACAKAVTRLEHLIDAYGFDTVLTDVLQVVCASRGRLFFRPFPHKPDLHASHLN